VSDTKDPASPASASILSVGTELTDGKIGDTHGRYLSAALRALSIQVRRIVSIPDDRLQFMAEVRMATKESSLLIVTGGLGPTSDDLTREVIAAVAGMELEFLPAAWESIERRLGTGLSETNRKQAYIPHGFDLVPNDNGSAPGFMGAIGACQVVCLPGPPRELRPMFERAIVPHLRTWFSAPAAEELAASAFMLPESALEELLQRHRHGDVTWGTRFDEFRIAFFLRGGTDSDRRATFAAIANEAGWQKIREGEVDPAQVVFEELRIRGTTLSTAESCTGGLVAKLITDIAGSSSVLWGGWVVYSNDAKVRQLGVNARTLEDHGAVSRETVREMASSACSLSGSDYAVAVSGIAGPDGGTAEKPVGTVWIGVAARDGRAIEELYSFRGDRSRVRRSSAVAALLLVEQLIGRTDGVKEKNGPA